jgi:hypothetical protein
MDYKYGVGPNGEGQRPELPKELELRPDQLQIGQVYRIQQYRDNERRGGPDSATYDKMGPMFMNFTDNLTGQKIEILPAQTTPKNTGYYYRIFQAESSKAGGRKRKTRQTKLRRIRRKNRTRKNRRRTNRRR